MIRTALTMALEGVIFFGAMAAVSTLIWMVA